MSELASESSTQPAPLLRPVAPDARERSEVGAFLGWLEQRRELRFADYDELHRWSVTDLDGFWSAVAEYFQVRWHVPPTAVLGQRTMPGATWFPGSTLNYAEHALGLARGDRPARPDDEPALLGRSQTRPPVDVTWAQLRDQVARARAGLLRLGVRRGDRVVAYLPNIPETVVAYLATASIGAIWAVCAPEFGPRSVVDRFAQLEPAVLLTVAGYRYGTKDVDRSAEVAQVRAGLPTLRHVVDVPYLGGPVPDAVSWDDLLAEPAELAFDAVEFAHPLCVLFSSGTTGIPKAIVHGHGGLLVEHLKNHGLSWDLRPGDRIQWFSTTAWMMWNALVSALLTGSSAVLLDGNPGHPDLGEQFRLAGEVGATLLGASSAYVMGARAAGVVPGALPALRQVVVAGSPLPAEGYHWLDEQLGPDVAINVGSGGTDVCTGIVQGGPLQPVWVGEISGPCLGVAAQAFDEDGKAVVGELGELVITAPMPSMPVAFWKDRPVTEEGSRYRETYFSAYPGVWCHGDWTRFLPTGSCVIAGRSDATLNRGGVRLGTAEFYEVIEELPQVVDSLVVHLEDPAGGMGELLVFVELAEGVVLDNALRTSIGRALRDARSPRHVPDRVVAVPAIPRNRTGKKLELPAKRILQGRRLEDVASREVLAVPTALDAFVELAAERTGS
ncbi:acetoacetate--CoA ligase [Pseudonocardia sp. CA-107938]|uniref:acetoacetate--CoA ligase n=1 Tax=Pseudonocardia sp. CA-107938 TaxID=3240021 RepID=UPI003D919D08